MLRKAGYLFAILATTSLAAPAFGEAAKAVAPATDAQVLLAAGKRTMEVPVETIVRLPCDQFIVRFEVTSALTTPDQAAPRVEKLLDRVQDALRLANLPAAMPDDGVAPTAPEAGNGGQVAVFNAYRVTAGSIAQARAVQAALAPFVVSGRQVVKGREVTDASVAAAAKVEARSTKYDADPAVAMAAARQQAIAAARAQADATAAALKVKLGPPLAIGRIAVTQAVGEESAEKILFVSGTIVFEVTE